MDLVVPESKDIWDWKGFRKIIPVNLCVNKNGLSAMNAGLAKQCLDRYPGINKRFGQYVLIKKTLSVSNTRLLYVEDDVILLPTKKHWKQRDDYELIELGLKFIENNILYDERHKREVLPIVFPRIGCGSSALKWDKTKSTILGRLISHTKVVFFTDP